MKLHPSHQTKLDYLLPDDIVEYCRFDRFDFYLKLSGTSCAGRQPEVNIRLDGKIITSTRVGNNGFDFEYSEKLDMTLTNKVLEIEYVGKTNNDTLIDNNGNIVENQSLTIKELVVNGIDIIANDTMPELGNYTMQLDPEKLAYYQEHGYHTEPTTNLDMYENGVWRLTFPIPIITHIAKIKNKLDPHEKWPDPDLLDDIITTINDIRSLEQKLKERR